MNYFGLVLACISGVLLSEMFRCVWMQDAQTAAGLGVMFVILAVSASLAVD